LARYASPGCPVPRTHLPRRRRISGLPRIFGPLAVPAVDLRVAPKLATFCVAGSVEPRVAPFLHFLPSASDEFPGCPRFCISGFTGGGASSRLESRILRRCRLANSPGCPASSAPRYRRRPVSGLPRILYPPAPADLSPSCLGLRTIRLCQRRISGSPRIFLSSGYASEINFRVSPDLHSSGGANRTNFQVALKLRSVCAAD